MSRRFDQTLQSVSPAQSADASESLSEKVWGSKERMRTQLQAAANRMPVLKGIIASFSGGIHLGKLVRGLYNHYRKRSDPWPDQIAYPGSNETEFGKFMFNDNHYGRVVTKNDMGWYFRFPLPRQPIVMKASLNVALSKEMIYELDDLFLNGLIKGEYKVPTKWNSKRFDSVSIYFYEEPSNETKRKIAEFAIKHKRGDVFQLIGEQVFADCPWFSLFPFGEIEEIHVLNLYRLLLLIDKEIAGQLKGEISQEGTRFALSEGQYYALKTVLAVFGIDLNYDRRNGFSLYKDGQKIDDECLSKHGIPILKRGSESSLEAFGYASIGADREIELKPEEQKQVNIFSNGKSLGGFYITKDLYGFMRIQFFGSLKVDGFEQRMFLLEDNKLDFYRLGVGGGDWSLRVESQGISINNKNVNNVHYAIGKIIFLNDNEGKSIGVQSEKRLFSVERNSNFLVISSPGGVQNVSEGGIVHYKVSNAKFEIGYFGSYFLLFNESYLSNLRIIVNPLSPKDDKNLASPAQSADHSAITDGTEDLLAEAVNAVSSAVDYAATSNKFSSLKGLFYMQPSSEMDKILGRKREYALYWLNDTVNVENRVNKELIARSQWMLSRNAGLKVNPYAEEARRDDSYDTFKVYKPEIWEKFKEQFPEIHVSDGGYANDGKWDKMDFWFGYVASKKDINIGWKVHLNVLPEHSQYVAKYLIAKGYAHKFLSRGELGDGKVFTVYLGSFDMVKKASAEISKDLTGYLALPAEESEIEFAPGVVGRFCGDVRWFAQYGYNGTSSTRDGADILANIGYYAKTEQQKIEIRERVRQEAVRKLYERYGSYFWDFSMETVSDNNARSVLKETGGIDLTAGRMNLDVNADNAATASPVDLRAIENIEINGLYIKDLRIRPMTNLPQVLGLAA